MGARARTRAHALCYGQRMVLRPPSPGARFFGATADTARDRCMFSGAAKTSCPCRSRARPSLSVKHQPHHSLAPPSPLSSILGFKKFVIHNPAELEILLMHNRTYAAEVAHGVGARKRALIVARAKALNVNLTNGAAKVRSQEDA